MEAQLSAGEWVLGVDEHTVCVFDLVARTASVLGLGSVTIRAHGSSVVVPTGAALAIDDLIASGTEGAVTGGLGGLPGVGLGHPLGGPGAGVVSPSGETGEPPSLSAEAVRISAAFDGAVGRRDGPAATEAVLELEAVLHAWSADTFESDELDRARAALRRMVVRLGEFAAAGLREPRDLVAPWVEALLAERTEARAGRRFTDADRIRDALEQAGVEVRDTPERTEWGLRPE